MSAVSEIFKCKRCGYCCHGQTTVSLDVDDQKRMIETLGLPKKQVIEKFWRVSGHIVQMKIKDGHCIFYRSGCTVHEGRPWRCAEWPLHPSILTDENNFISIAESCPGIRKEIGYTKFCEILKDLMKKSNIRC